MATRETAYKNRMDALFRKISKDTGLKFWRMAFGTGVINGVPDKWYQLGSFMCLFELKRGGKQARPLQQDRIDNFVKHNIPSFCLAANQKSTGPKGEERREALEELQKWVTQEKVNERVIAHVSDCRVLRQYIKRELKKW